MQQQRCVVTGFAPRRTIAEPYCGEVKTRLATGARYRHLVFAVGSDSGAHLGGLLVCHIMRRTLGRDNALDHLFRLTDNGEIVIEVTQPALSESDASCGTAPSSGFILISLPAYRVFRTLVLGNLP